MYILCSDSSEKKFFCEQCNKRFIYQHSLNRHKLSHNERIKHVCDICGVEYLSIQNFKEHMLFKHNSKDASDLVCEICGFSTISRLKLTVHIHAKHATGKHKQCSYCDFKTPWIQKLQIHIDVKHPDQGNLLKGIVELVSKELNHFGVIAGLFRQIGGHSTHWLYRSYYAKKMRAQD